MAGIYTFVYHVALFGIEAKKKEISVLGRLESFLGQRLQEFVVTPLCNGQDTDRKTADLK